MERTTNDYVFTDTSRKRFLLTTILAAMLSLLFLFSLGTLSYASESLEENLDAESWVYKVPAETNGETVYHRISIKKAGYITVEGAAFSEDAQKSLDIEFTDANQRDLESKTLKKSNGYTTYFGVKKGTYYIAASPADDESYQLRYFFNAVTDKSGSSKSRAVTLKNGKTRRGLFLASESVGSRDWFKIVLNKKQKFSYQVDCRTGNKIKVKIIPKKKGVSISKNLQTTKTGGYIFNTTNQAPKGTYYIRVSKASGSSGYYSITRTK